MQEIISKEQFHIELMTLAERNWKVKGLLANDKGYDGLNDHIKKLIDKELNVEHITIIVRKEN